MTKIKYSILGKKVLIISLGELPNEVESFLKVQNQDNDLTVILYPSMSADFALFSCDKNMEESEKYVLSALAAGAFIFDYRGLPLSEAVFETPIGKIEIFNTGSGEISVNSMKCKHLYTNKAFDFLGADVDVSLYSVYGLNVAFLFCEKTDLFDFSLTPSLLLSLPDNPKYLQVASDRKKTLTFQYRLLTN